MNEDEMLLQFLENNYEMKHKNMYYLDGICVTVHKDGLEIENVSNEHIDLSQILKW